MKSILAGITLCAASLLIAQDAKALTPAQIPVTSMCPEATWAAGYAIGELIPLAQRQYKVGLITNGPSNVRSGAGFESPVLFTLNAGEQVTIAGEAWDIGCNQWMYVIVNSQFYWMHGSQLRML